MAPPAAAGAGGDWVAKEDKRVGLGVLAHPGIVAVDFEVHHPGKELGDMSLLLMFCLKLIMINKTHTQIDSIPQGTPHSNFLILSSYCSLSGAQCGQAARGHLETTTSRYLEIFPVSHL